MSVHDIPLSTASTKTQNFQTVYPTLAKGGAFPKDEVIQILSQAGCVGLRYYFALDNTTAPNALHVVLCGIDANGDMLTITVNGVTTDAKLKDAAIICPPNCATGNSLNHI